MYHIMRRNILYTVIILLVAASIHLLRGYLIGVGGYENFSGVGFIINIISYAVVLTIIGFPLLRSFAQPSVKLPNPLLFVGTMLVALLLILTLYTQGRIDPLLGVFLIIVLLAGFFLSLYLWIGRR